MIFIFRKISYELGRAFGSFFNIKVSLKYLLILVLVFAVAAAAVSSAVIIRDIGGTKNYSDAKQYIEIRDIVADNYIDEVDEEELLGYAASAIISGLGDKWSYYMSEDEYNNFLLSSSNEYASLGMQIMQTKNGEFQVTGVNSGSAAALGGLSAGSIIDGVDGQRVKNMSLDEVRTLIRSKMNTVFTLNLKDGTDVEVDCKALYISPVTYEIAKTGAGYVKISSFEAGGGSDAVSAIEDLVNQGIKELCIDVRDNPGGLMNELETILDYLLPSGDLFVSIDKYGKEEIVRSDNLSISMKMTVLTNANTFGAAELFAAALQEYNWADVIGEATTGNTRQQETIQLEDGSAVRLSTHKYLTPLRVDLSSSGGVIPDQVVYQTSDPALADDQLDAALKSMSYGA